MPSLLGISGGTALIQINRVNSNQPRQFKSTASDAGLIDFDDSGRIRFAERFAIPQERRMGEHINLRSCVIDVILANNRMPNEGQQIGQRVAEHCTATVTDVHGTGRVG